MGRTSHVVDLGHRCGSHRYLDHPHRGEAEPSAGAASGCLIQPANGPGKAVVKASRASRPLGWLLLFVRLLRRSEQAAEGEVLRSICRRTSDPWIRGPVAHPAHDDLDVALAGGRPKLVGAALRTPIRRVHGTRVRRNLVWSENLAPFRSQVRLAEARGTRAAPSRRGGRVV